ncbi:hypothetical protein PPERSA_01019 [Pseudocohnilembus persalinus]|uniref:Uncharacterized protein n=1 Tax=Pseudocohnilembus persalinus TaxID=266149 RepID=A0A0V0QVN1_PSEPJ|nr:hypothetical protein PPERSA_01019 [Pseudocohnilembus persalinus]|eukprot:KRX05941.1 hypothetical protein PPERSA_01019 [Pseudocohnilembus persalinus]
MKKIEQTQLIEEEFDPQIQNNRTILENLNEIKKQVEFKNEQVKENHKQVQENYKMLKEDLQGQLLQRNNLIEEYEKLDKSSQDFAQNYPIEVNYLSQQLELKLANLYIKN